MARDTDGEPRLSHVRDFNLDGAPISAIAPEQRRKGFIALDEKGNLGVFHSTAHRTLLVQPVADSSGVITRRRGPTACCWSRVARSTASP